MLRVVGRRFRKRLPVLVGLCVFLAWPTLGAQVRQNPSPMVDTTRPHPRIEPPIADGQREALSVGTLFISGNFGGNETVPVIVNFHHAFWLGEHYVSQLMPDTALVMVPLGAGSKVYNDSRR